MKKVVCIVLMVIVVLNSTGLMVFAENYDHSTIRSDCKLTLLRAGGGDSGGDSGSGGGGGSGGDSSPGYSGNSMGRNRRGSILSHILFFLFFVVSASASAIVFHFKLSKYARNTKKIIKKLEKNDAAWNYKELQQQVCETFYAVQEAWSMLDMKPAEQYMSEELYESFQTKLAWMAYRHQKNVLEKIKLLDAFPVSLYNGQDNSIGYVWFYIKGKMIDYMIDTDNYLKISGSSTAQSFCEYWQFIRNENGRWVLNKIFQKNESDKIVFSDSQ